MADMVNIPDKLDMVNMVDRDRDMTAIQEMCDWEGDEDSSLNRNTNKNTKMNRKQMLV